MRKAITYQNGMKRRKVSVNRNPQKSRIFLVARPLRPYPPPPPKKKIKNQLNKICFILDWEQNKENIKKRYFLVARPLTPPSPS